MPCWSAACLGWRRSPWQARFRFGFMRIWRLAACLVILLILSSLPTGQAYTARPGQDAAPLGLDDYWKLVEETGDTLGRLVGKPESQYRAAILDLSSRWELITEVRLGDGSSIPVDNSYLVSVLKSGEAGAAHKLVLALLEAHRKYPSELFTTQDLAGLEQILARPEFQWPEPKPNPIGEWLQKMLDRFFQWLDKLLGNGNASGEPREISVSGNSL